MFNGPICIVFETNKVIYEHFGPHYWSQLQKRALKRIVVLLAKECNNLSAVFKKYHFLRLIFHTFDKKLPYQVCLNSSPGIQVKMHFYKLWDGNFFWPKCTVLLVFFSYTNVQYFWYFFDPNVQYFWYFFFLSQIYSTFGFFFWLKMYSTFGILFFWPKCTVLLVFLWLKCTVLLVLFLLTQNVQYFFYWHWHESRVGHDDERWERVVIGRMHKHVYKKN